LHSSAASAGVSDKPLPFHKLYNLISSVGNGYPISENKNGMIFTTIFLYEAAAYRNLDAMGGAGYQL
jgi:hypothetical protein